VEKFARRAHRALGLPQRRATIVSERIESADVGQHEDFIAAKARSPDQVVK
jgi:hypothetical protein